MKKLVVCALTASMVLGISSPVYAEEEKTYKIGMSIDTTSQPWRAGLADDVTKEAEKYDNVNKLSVKLTLSTITSLDTFKSTGAKFQIAKTPFSTKRSLISCAAEAGVVIIPICTFEFSVNSANFEI